MYYSPTVAGLRSELASAQFAASVAQGAVFAARRDSAVARASATDASIGGAIHEGAADGYAAVCVELRSRLMTTTADRDRLQDRVDDLVIERSALLAHCASLLAENDSLRARRR